jgi:hypothetical protein
MAAEKQRRPPGTGRAASRLGLGQVRAADDIANASATQARLSRTFLKLRLALAIEAGDDATVARLLPLVNRALNGRSS